MEGLTGLGRCAWDRRDNRECSEEWLTAFLLRPPIMSAPTGERMAIRARGAEVIAVAVRLWRNGT